MYLDILQSSILNDPKLIQSNYTELYAIKSRFYLNILQ